MAGPVLAIDGVTLEFGGVRALDGVSFEVREGELLALIGPNGAGKTSILNCISGLYRPAVGKIDFLARDGTSHPLIRLRPHRIAELGIARTFQAIELFKRMSVLDNIMLGRHLRMAGGVLSGGFYWGRQSGREIEQRTRVEEIIDFLNLEPFRRETVGTLSYGVQKVVELGRALALDPSLLLLDEPMAGLNTEEKESMARFLLDVQEEWGVTQVLVDHDMDVVMDLATRAVVFDFGQVLATGSPGAIRENPKVLEAYLGGPVRTKSSMTGPAGSTD